MISIWTKPFGLHSIIKNISALQPSRHNALNQRCLTLVHRLRRWTNVKQHWFNVLCLLGRAAEGCSTSVSWLVYSRRACWAWLLLAVFRESGHMHSTDMDTVRTTWHIQLAYSDHSNVRLHTPRSVTCGMHSSTQNITTHCNTWGYQSVTW